MLGAACPTLAGQPTKLNVSFDYATFKYDSIRSYAEFYYSFNGKSLSFIQKSDKNAPGSTSFVDSLLFEVLIGKKDSVSDLRKQIWKVPITIPDTTQEYLGKSFVGKIDFALLPGEYFLRACCYDVNDSLSSDSLNVDFPIPSYQGSNLESSEIEFCSNITQGDTGSIFYKNTYDVVPNPTGLYGMGMPIIYYYLELYNIGNNGKDSLFTVSYEIRDSFGQVRKSHSTTRKKFGGSSVEVGTVNGSNLKTGTYTFTFTAVDSVENLFTKSSKRFFVYNPGLGKPEAPDSNFSGGAVLSSAFAAMGEEQLDQEFAEARYLSTTSDQDQYEKLSGVGSKRQFLYEFWDKRIAAESNGVKDTRTDYLQRVNYANSHFRIGMRDGWKTDRGRVYIIYGNPDEIDRHPNETDSKPYEIWYYNSVEGGVSFDFVDRTGFGDYMLVNSTERNEIHDDNWQQYITQ